MNEAIWKVCEAWVCAPCRKDMADEYVIREIGPRRKGTCECCGEISPSTVKIKYTMNKRGLERRGRLNG